MVLRLQVAQTGGPCSILAFTRTTLSLSSSIFACGYSDARRRSVLHNHLTYYEHTHTFSQDTRSTIRITDHGMTSLQVPAATAADESQQNHTQDDGVFEQIEAPVTFKVDRTTITISMQELIIKQPIGDPDVRFRSLRRHALWLRLRIH